MNLTETRNLPGCRQHQRVGVPFGLIAFCLTALASAATAQPATEPPPLELAAPAIEPEMRAAETNAPPLLPTPDFSSVAPPPSIAGTSQLAPAPPVSAADFLAGPPLLELGPVRLRPHVVYRLMYGDGIQAQPGQAAKTTINQLLPGIFLQIGNHWTLDYTPTLSYYSSSQFRDTLDHSVILAGSTRYEDWTFGLSQAYASSSQPLVETASQTDQELYTTLFNAAYQMSSAMSLEMGINQVFRFVGETVPAGEFTDMRSWGARSWLNYQFAPRFVAGIGVGFGYDDLTVGSDMTAEQLQGRVSWRVKDKLSLVLTAGVEDRQFLNSGEPDALNPLLGASAQYQVFETTMLSLNANQSVSPAYFQNQLLVSSEVSGGLHQRLVKSLYLDVRGGYRAGSYSTTTAGLTVTRNDHGTFVNVRLGTVIFKRGTASVFYDYSDNTSNDNNFQYSSTQVGLELGYRL